MRIGIEIELRGPLLTGKAAPIGARALKQQAIEKILERWLRPGRRAGRRNNTLSRRDLKELEVEVTSTLRNPRQSGGSWRRKQYGIARSMTPRVVRKAAEAAAREAGGA